MAEFINHLANEKSPYLQQHVHNPVDWYPWGEEAFAIAEAHDKPIFLSIGYSTCHWCHVMERESFENPEIARLMNMVFVCIKVDREELPHVDSLYMEFAQVLLSSGGGWPLNVILTPDRKPFFAVTYLPPKARQGLIGFDQFIMQIQELWESDERQALLEQANSLVDAMARVLHESGSELPDEETVTDACEIFFNLADSTYGGMSKEPKFPLSYQLELLLQFTKASNESRALFFVELTLDHMHRGGIYDHVGGGFSRYATDEKWLIPHFEKMAYDNALLAKSYLEAWKFTKKESYRRVTEETCRYLLREMQDPEGGFYSGLDADTEGHEGLYYTWTPLEVNEILTPNESALFCTFYGVTLEGNFEGRSVLHCANTFEEFAETRGLAVEELSSRLERAKKELLKSREKRARPFRDTKILTGWNGLLIDLFAHAGSSFNEKSFTDAALKAAQFIKTHLWKEGKLLRRYCDKEARFSGVVEDYAFLIKGLLTLFELGHGSEWLGWATELAAVLQNDFQAPRGAFYQTESSEEVLLRKCEFYDGAEPSGNGVHAENLIRLYQITKEDIFRIQAEDIFKAALKFIEAYPPGSFYHLKAIQRYYDLKAPTLVIALDEQGSLEKEIKEHLSKHFCPHAAIIWKRPKDTQIERDKLPIDGQTAVYLCRQNECEPPLISKEEIMKVIESL